MGKGVSGNCREALSISSKGISQESLRDLLDGEYLYHCVSLKRMGSGGPVSGEQVLKSIRNYGLLPWDHERSLGSVYQGRFSEPRPGCIYLSNNPHYGCQEPCDCCLRFRIGISRLDTRRLVADEDEIFPGGGPWGYKDPSVSDFQAGRGPSLGAYADQLGLDHEEHIRYCFRRGVGSCALKGTIPYQAIELVDIKAHQDLALS